jgi:protein-tyrosine kinase
LILNPIEKIENISNQTGINSEVRQLGKIFDALEKSEKENKISTMGCKSAVAFENDQKEKHEPWFDESKAVFDSKNINRNLVSLKEPNSFEAEQFRILRTNLLFPVSGKPPRSILITSAVPGEGKSFVASNLAISIARNIDEHVLLMDCDMRKPCLHSRFGLGDVQGLSEYLCNGTPLPSVLVKTKIGKLTILPGGKPPKNPSELLSSAQMAALLEEVKTRYLDRYIIIDSPPPRLTAETGAIARNVDGVLLVVKYGSTRREVIEDMVDMIGKEKILGVVMNWFNLRSSTYYGYGTYKKYNKYYSKK